MGTATTRPTTYLRLGERKIPVPKSRALRMGLGVLLILGGVVPLVPPGVGGIPVGMALLSLDHPRLRRPRRRMVVWGGRRLKSLLARQGTDSRPRVL
jgi:hypothetical protein